MFSIMDKFGSFVKEQMEYNERSAMQYCNDEHRFHAYHERANMFARLLQEMQSAENEEFARDAEPFYDESLFRLTSDEIQDLPKELLEQLSLTEGDKLEFLIADMIKDLGGATSIDKLLIALYRRTGEVEKRTKLNARLYKMVNKRMVFAHPQRKGVYSLRPFPEFTLQSAMFTDDVQDEEL